MPNDTGTQTLEPGDIIKDDFDPYSVIMLIRWLQYSVKAPDGKAYTIDRIAEALGTNRNVLNRFLQQKLNTDEERKRARNYAVQLQPILDQGRPFPVPVLGLHADVYRESEALDLDDRNPVQMVEVMRHKSMSRVSQEPADITPLTGLSALVRLSNEAVPAPELGDGARLPGWSLSVLNVLPSHVQVGLNHPLFILRQKGLNSTIPLTVNGIVVPQDDRFVFLGVDTDSRRSFQATLRVPGNNWPNFRNPETSPAIAGSGVMLGLSSHRAAFAGLFDLFAIPRTALIQDASETDKLAFRDRYRMIVDNSPGVRNLDDTVTELAKLGIKGGKDHLADVLRDMRDRMGSKDLLKP